MLDNPKLSDEQQVGVRIIRCRAIEEPLRQIVQNAGEEGSIIVQKVKEGTGNFGFNAGTGKVRRPGCRRRHRPGRGRALLLCRTLPAFRA